MENMLIGSAFPTAADRINVEQAAIQAAAYGDTVQQNKLALKVQQMQMAEFEKAQGVKNFLASNWAGMTGGAPQAAPPAPPPGMPPVNNLAPKMMTGNGIGAGMLTPGITDPTLQPGAPAPAAPPQAATGPAAPPQRYPSDEQLMAAVNSGKIPMNVAVGVRAERTAYEQAQQQEAVKARVEWFKKLSEEAVKAGNNEGFQAVMQAAQADPLVRHLIPKFDEIKITGKQEVETVKPFTAEEITAIATKFPDLGLDPNNPPKPGTYKMVKKAGQIIKWEPAKDAGESSKTPEQLRRVFTDPKQPEEARKQAWEDFKLAPLTVNQLTAIKTNKSLPAEYRQFATDTLAEMNKQKTSFHMSIKGSMDDSGVDSFKDYTPEMKMQAFKDRDLGQYKYPSGMKSMAEKKAFDKEYYKYRVTGKVSAADVASARSDAKALTTLTNREQLIGTFTTRIEANTKVVESAYRFLKNKDSRLLNKPINSLASVLGSGQLQAVRLALRSLSNEIAKVESGSLGIAEVSKDQAEYMHKIHDENLSLADMKIIMEMGTKLGKTSMKAIKQQRLDLKNRVDRGDSADAGLTGGGLNLDMNAIDAAIARKTKGQ